MLKGLFADEPCTFAGEHFTVTALDGLPKPVQRPHPPIMIGGGGRKVLSVAARQADIIQVLPGRDPRRGRARRSQFAARSYREKIDWIRDAAGERFDAIELGTLLMHVAITDDVERAQDEFLAQFPSEAVRDERDCVPSCSRRRSSPSARSTRCATSSSRRATSSASAISARPSAVRPRCSRR